MKVLNVRNVHEALPRGLHFLQQIGEERNSRNGTVLQAPWPVTTVYEKPCERVIFWPERDANPFFHLYESLWMLAGRNDLAPLLRYAKNMGNYSDDGISVHGAYGYRWRNHFSSPNYYGTDQLQVIAEQLQANPEDRRCILQMWNTYDDLRQIGKDVPCNTIATFQRGFEGELNLSVFCRSNDIVWGAYGANAVHFSMLLEYMALWIGCPIGTYTQISINWHGYTNTLDMVKNLRPDSVNFVDNPYIDGRVHHVPMDGLTVNGSRIKYINQVIEDVLHYEALNFAGSHTPSELWARMIWCVLAAHAEYRLQSGENKYKQALVILAMGDQKSDWIVAATEWIQRRQKVFYAKQLAGG